MQQSGEIGLDERGDSVVERQLEALWAKSNAGGRWHCLVGHCYDTAAVAELLWDDFLGPAARRRLDEALEGHGRQALVLMAGCHDCGKATPAFQAQVPELASRVQAAGLSPLRSPSLRHGDSSAVILKQHLRERGRAQLAKWVAPIVRGHHGIFSTGHPELEAAPGHRGSPRGNDWRPVQEHLVNRVLSDFDALPAADLPSPSTSLQLALAGFVSMADWIASSDHFPGLDASEVSVETARERARAAWDRLALGRGWRLDDDLVQFVDRFGVQPRPVQQLAVDAALRVGRPGLMIIEAPMGEGKTEAGCAVVETLARRFGFDGFCFAMPTQGTTDAMYDRVRGWAESIDPEVPVALLHGKSRLNPAWRHLIEQVQVARVTGVDEFGIASDLDFEVDLARGGRQPGPLAVAPSSWLLGRHRPLLCPGVVGTVDQVLVAATSTKYVSLRHAGLLGKVLVIDEVHSYDAYTSAFLRELLGWCAGAAVPVVLMSATLPPKLRVELAQAYCERLELDDRRVVEARIEREVGTAAGYPRLTSVDPAGAIEVASTSPWTRDRHVEIRIAPSQLDSVEIEIEAAETLSRDGGCVLAILSTVHRAQEVYGGLRERGVPTVLLHGRFTSAQRANRTRDLLAQLGATAHRGAGRPDGLVVVATQVAEQSFDVDVDALLTDIAPLDLLLQRVGRVHRHARPESDRPLGLRRAQVVITGMTGGAGTPPRIVGAIEGIYGAALLYRAAAAVLDEPTWSLPGQLPGLVAAAYDEDAPAPDGWGEAWRLSQIERDEFREDQSARADLAVLKRISRSTLFNLHRTSSPASLERVSVRDGEDSDEVVLVGFDGEQYTTLAGTPLGVNGERCHGNDEVALEVLGDTVRLPRNVHLSSVAPLPGWAGVPLLSGMRALALGPGYVAEIDDHLIRYDDDLGLVIGQDRGRR